MLFEMITSPLEWHELHEREKRNQFLKNSDSRPVGRGGGGGGVGGVGCVCTHPICTEVHLEHS